MGMSKTGPFWTFVRFVWAFRNIIAIVSLLLTVFYLMFSETLEQRRFMLSEFSEAYQNVSVAEGELKTTGDRVFREPSRSGAPVPAEAAAALENAVRDLRSALVAAPAPTGEIEQTRAAYAAELSDVLGAINLFELDGDGEGTIRLLGALDAVERPALAYGEAVNDFQTSVWTSFWAAF
jgi:hypothetical protein